MRTLGETRTHAIDRMCQAVKEMYELLENRSDLIGQIVFFAEREGDGITTDLLDSTAYCSFSGIRDRMKYEIYDALKSFPLFDLIGTSDDFFRRAVWFGLDKELGDEIVTKVKKQVLDKIYEIHWQGVRRNFYEALKKLPQFFV